MSNRLIGDLPKVGIRPVIDGRENGVRESVSYTHLTLPTTPYV
jgi:L-fucose isomerase